MAFYLLSFHENSVLLLILLTLEQWITQREYQLAEHEKESGYP